MYLKSTLTRRIGAVFLAGALALGSAACSSDPEDQVDEKEQEIRENTP